MVLVIAVYDRNILAAVTVHIHVHGLVVGLGVFGVKHTVTQAVYFQCFFRGGHISVAYRHANSARASKVGKEHLLNVRACSRMVIHRTPAVIFTVKYIHPDAVFRIIGIVIEHHRFIGTVHVKVIEHKSGTVCSPSGIYK